ncbi:sterol-sensing domain of SREBP cleavage-activation-domain-containing protein [Naematelia encephala]|uniref:Sterol regulatory element-binding protein cleavage-activating protein n=1 Tax=Naematelia encephala TaxID=71784 RepID=A0A1Y2AXY7_9TREE|nr:sterol-sensing domain of SREBP cleavage-activation-domain-containing protein [Naematelia encephala]
MSGSAVLPNGNAKASTSTAHLTNTSSVRQRYERTPSSTQRSGSTHHRMKRRVSDKGKSKERDWGRSKRAWVREGFRMFGEHCARNQIRTLLIDCLVMTNLFYPALSIYLQKKFPPLHPPSPPAHNTHLIPLHDQSQPFRRLRKEHPLSLLSTPVLDSFFPYPPPLLPRLTWAGWWGRDTGQLEDDKGWHASRVRDVDTLPDAEDEIRLMRVGWADVGDVLDGDSDYAEKSWAERDHLLLRLVSETAEGWAANFPTTGESCVRQMGNDPKDQASRERCYILSPRAGPEPIMPLATFSEEASQNTTYEEAHTPNGWLQDTSNVYHSLAAIFRVPSSSRATFEDRWASQIEQIAARVQGEVFVEANGLRGAAMDYSGDWLVSYRSQPGAQSLAPEPSQLATISPNPPFLVLLLYLVLFVALASQISNASKVHSRFGLAFTGIVQVCCSAVMSISVLALLGWNGWGTSQAQPSLPTWVLPFVIVVVGVENMSTLTKAVFSVPFTYSVPVRIGLALSKVGTTITITSLTDLLVLGVVWLCIGLAPVREFCLFAAVVIITDWFMLHTFFLTVLSIDAQRLELADVLSSTGGVTTPAVQEDSDAEKERYPKGFSWERLLRARTAKSGSLLVLLVTVVIIYYMTERESPISQLPASLYGYTPSQSSIPKQSTVARPSPFSTHHADIASLSPNERLWRSLNPSNWPSVRVIAPPASIVILPRPGHHMQPSDIRKLSLPTSRLVLPRLKPLFYLFKVVVLPQAVTAAALYALLLYLLKDSELLDAQRNKLGRSGGPPESESEAVSNLPPTSTRSLEVHMLPCSHEADVDLIASSADGRVTVSVAVDNTICLWRFGDVGSGSGTREPLNVSKDAGNDRVIAVTINEEGSHIAASLESGSIPLWEVPDDGKAIALLPRQVDVSCAEITAISFVAFEPHREIIEDPFSTPSASSSLEKTAPSLMIGLNDGNVVCLASDGSQRTIIPPAGRGSRVFFMSQPERIVVGSSLGSAVYQRPTSRPLTPALSTISEGNSLEQAEWTSIDLSSPATSGDRITSVTQHSLSTRDGTLDLLALGYKSGTVEVYDAFGTPLVTIGQSQTFEGIKGVGIASSATKCAGCGTTSNEGFLIVSSTANHVHLDRVLPKSAVFCRCTPTRRGSSLEETTTTPTKASPTRGLVVPPSSARALSPGSSPRKSPSLLPPISNGEFPLSSHGGARRLSNMHRDDDNRARPPSPLEVPNGLSPSVSGGPVSDGDWEVHPLGAVLSPSSIGCWVVLNDRLVGMRRVAGAIDDSGWQVWTIDLACPWNGTTLIVDSAPFAALAMRTARQITSPSSGLSIRERRNERLLSLDGRAAFPSHSGSFSVPTHPGLAYVDVRPFYTSREEGSREESTMEPRRCKGSVK